MTKWDYLIIQNHVPDPMDIEVRLHNLGSQGWELVSVQRDMFYLKKRVDGELQETKP